MTHRFNDRLERLEDVTTPPKPIQSVILTEHDPAPEDPDVFVIRLVGVKPAPRAFDECPPRVMMNRAGFAGGSLS